MVKELHKAGLEVILDVVYNHTGEGIKWAPRSVFGELITHLIIGSPTIGGIIWTIPVLEIPLIQIYLMC